METLIAEALKKTKDYEGMAKHSQEMLKVAKLIMTDKSREFFPARRHAFQSRLVSSRKLI